MAKPDDKKIETTAVRQKTLAAILVGTGIAAVVGLGILTEDQVATNIELRGRQFTSSEYVQYKQELVSKVREREGLTLDEQGDWFAMLNRECTKMELDKFGAVTVKQLNERLG